jgi:hypothetical protein
MWTLKKPAGAKLIIGLLGCDRNALDAAIKVITKKFGRIDLLSDIWPFEQTDYYRDETGDNILRQFVSAEKLMSPDRLADIKLQTNKLEKKLAKKIKTNLSRPVNIDPGLIESSKLVLATTKNYSHRIYIGKRIWGEATLVYDKGQWKTLDYTYPDYRQKCYHDFFSRVRTKLIQQLRE